MNTHQSTRLSVKPPSLKIRVGVNEREDVLRLMKEIDAFSFISQRELSARLGISLGKTNYLLRGLIKKSLVKTNGFSQTSDKKSRAEYLLTKDGKRERVRLVRHFFQLKKSEYDQIRNDLESLAGEDATRGKQI